MNIAILISVTTYADPQSNLPACANDFALMESIVTHSAKYSEILRLSEDTESSAVKSELAKFVKLHRHKTIDEIFFFFSGHGDVDSDDFYFLLSDFDESKREQTSLSNTELDSMLRSLSPGLAVKVVDACHSGVAYLKSESVLQKSLATSKGKYNSCYFMFSSQREEPSFQDSHLSDFTESFSRSILERSQDTVRYKDIMDQISDEFRNKGRQTPAFVAQADFTDVFCKITAEMRNDLRQWLHGSPVATATSKSDTTALVASEPKPRTALRELVVQESKQFCTEAEAMEALDNLQCTLENYALQGDVVDLYDYAFVPRIDYYDIPKMSSIATWLFQNQNSYFVEVQYEDEDYKDVIQVPRTHSTLFGSAITQMAALTGRDYETKVVTRTRKVPDTILLTAQAPLCAAEMRLMPRYQNLTWWTGYLVLVFSKSDLRIFYTFSKLKEKNWTERVCSGEIKWKTKEIGLKDSAGVTEAVKRIADELVDAATKALRDRYGMEQLRPEEPASPVSGEGGTENDR